jgi:hypothetical protein
VSGAKLEKGISSNFFLPPNGRQEQENRGINQQSKETATVCTVSSAALEVKGTVDPSQ